ncbi:MAG: helix-turn-helix domain-containing protein [Gammaproteobacteria bacterium]
MFPLITAPLRERAGDIPLLVRFLIDKFTTRIGKPVQGLSEKSMQRLQAYRWPGNIRELENVIERAIILADGPVIEIDPEMLPGSTAPAIDPVYPPSDASLEAVERQHILRVLEETKWVIEGPNGAAKILNLHSSTLRYRMKVLGITRVRH